MVRTVDFHTHIYPDEVAEKVLANLEKHYGVKRKAEATSAALISSMQAAGVEQSVVLPVATRPEHLSSNLWYAELGKKSKGKIIPFGSYHPEASLEVVEAFPEMGLAGLKIQPNAWKMEPANPKLFPLYKKAQELGLVIVFHAGDEEGGKAGEYSEPSMFAQFLKKFPELRVVLAHLGGYQRWSEIDVLLPFPQAYFDTSYTLHSLGKEKFLSLVEKIGEERILFGTDFPFRDQKEEKEKLISWLGERSPVFQTNALKILPESKKLF